MILKAYHKLVLSTTPSKSWKAIRFVIHWVTIPLKLAVIGSLGLYQIAVKSVFTRKTKVHKSETMPEEKTKILKNIMDWMPIYRTDEAELYVNRVPYRKPANGSNHNTDHQCARQGTYVFLKRRLGLDVELAENALANHMQRKWLLRGYKINPYDGSEMYNIQSVSGDMLTGLSLGMLGTKNYGMRDRFYELIHAIIENDYAILEHDRPDKDTPGYEEYQRQYKETFEQPHLIRLKSYKGRWEPGLDVVGAQALTVLAALRIGDKVCGATDAKTEYKKLLFKYGYGLLSLFPTAYIDSKRGYFNDHNCMVNLYVLSKLADSTAGRLFWKAAMVYTWALSKHWYNSYFTGLLNDAHPGTVSAEYLKQCEQYLYAEFPRNYGFDNGSRTEKAVTEPALFNDIAEDEFAADCRMDRESYDDGENVVAVGLGYMAHAVMLETDPKKLVVQHE